MDADKALTKAITIDPQYIDAKLARAELYIYSEDKQWPQQAKAILKQLSTKTNLHSQT